MGVCHGQSSSTQLLREPVRTRLKSDSPKSARGWFSLDNLAFQFGIPGKLGDITELARRFNPSTPKDELDF